MTQVFDVAVIGAGPGGLDAAIHCQSHGFKTVLIDKKHPGGTCLNVGCIPTKSLLSSARFYDKIKKADAYGIKITDVAFDWEGIKKRKNEVVERLRKGAATSIDKSGVKWIQGTARFKSAHVLEVTGDEAQDIEAKNIIIATGSSPAELPELPFKENNIISSDQVLELSVLPKKMLIVGGGAIGVEFASLFHALGVDITLIEMMERLLPTEDEDCSKRLESYFSRKRIEVITGVKIDKAQSGEAAFGNGKTWKGDCILVGVGRKRNTDDLNLESANVVCESNGAVKVNQHLETATRGIFAIGDVTASPQLAHTATHEGLHVAQQIITGSRSEIQYTANPNAVYSDPEVASVGLQNMKDAEAIGDLVATKIPFAAVGKSQVEGETDGFLKLGASKKRGVVLGAAGVGAHVTELLPELTLAVRLKLTVRDIAETVHAHPTEAEIIQLAARDLIRKL